VTDGKSGIATLPHVDDTVALGALLGSRLRAGDVVVLSGPLGAGKNCAGQGNCGGDGRRRAGDLADVRAGSGAFRRDAPVPPP